MNSPKREWILPAFFSVLLPVIFVLLMGACAYKSAMWKIERLVQQLAEAEARLMASLTSLKRK